MKYKLNMIDKYCQILFQSYTRLKHPLEEIVSNVDVIKEMLQC